MSIHFKNIFMSYKLKWKKNDVIIIFENDIGFEDITRANEIIYGSPKFDNMRYQIVDFQNVNNVSISKDELDVIGTLEKSATIWNNEVKIACVTTNNYIKELFSEYAKTMQSTNWECKIFDNYFAAEEWCKKSVDARVSIK